MKKFFYLMAVCAAAAACAKVAPEMGSEQSFSGTEKVLLEVGLPETMWKVGTKTTEDAGEETVENIQVFIFDESNGRLDSYSNKDSVAVTLTCTPGKKDVYVVVNAPDLSKYGNSEALRSAVSKLSENSKGHFVMTGMKKVTIGSVPDPIKVDVDRKVAKICLQSVQNKITIPQYAGKELWIKAVYLVNVAADVPYYTAHNNTEWINFRTAEIKDNVFYYDTVNNVKVTPEHSYSSAHAFYCYPNTTADDSSDPVSDTARFTRLVVEASLGGNTYYYPVSIEQIASNKSYTINLGITRPGSSSPDVPVSKMAAEVSVNVQPWIPTEPVYEEI